MGYLFGGLMGVLSYTEGDSSEPRFLAVKPFMDIIYNHNLVFVAL